MYQTVAKERPIPYQDYGGAAILFGRVPGPAFGVADAVDVELQLRA